MKLTRIELAGFRGVRETVRISVPSGFLVLVGRNGSGKSTIVDAIEFVLSGKIREAVHKEKGESYSDYIWWRGKGRSPNHWVRLSFVDNSGHEFTIERDQSGISPESEDHLTRFFQQDIAPDSPISNMCRTSILRDEAITSLSIDLPEADRYRFVRDALGNVAATDLERRIDELRDGLQRRVKDFQKHYDHMRRRVAELTSRLSDTQATIAASAGNAYSTEELCSLFGVSSSTTSDLLQQGRLKSAEMRRQLDHVHALLSQLEALEAARSDVESDSFVKKIAENEQQIADAKQRLSELSQDHSSLAERIAEVRANDPSRASLGDLLTAGENLGLSPDGKCPLCGSTVSGTAFHSHISDAKARLEHEHSELLQQLEKESVLSARKGIEQKTLDELLRKLNELHSRKNQVAEKMAAISTEANSSGVMASGESVTIAKLQSFAEKIRGRLLHVEEAVAWLESSSLAELVDSLQAELAESNEQSKQASERLSWGEAAVSKVNDAKKGVRSVLGEVVDEQLAELSPLIEELYKRLRPHIEWTQFRYRLRGDVRRMLSFEVGDGLNPSFMFSSGQRRAAGLAFLLSVHLSRPWCNWNTLVLDDPVQHVDDYRALNLTEVLSAIRKTGRQILVSVEDEALAQLLCRRLQNNVHAAGSLLHMHYDRESGVQVEKSSVFEPLRSDVLVPA